MSRLWPRRALIGLTATSAWLRLGRHYQHFVFDQRLEPTEASLHNVLTPILKQAGSTIDWRFVRLSILLEDAWARVIELPWQSALTHPTEWRAYAESRYEALGLGIDSEWALHADYQHFSRPGVAYALPRAWLVALQTSAAEHGSRIDEVLPMTASLYFRQRISRRSLCLTLLASPERMSLLVSDRGGLLALHGSPGALSFAGKRLFRLAASRHASVNRIKLWLHDLSQQDELRAELRQWWPAAAVDVRSPQDWRA